MNYPIHHFRRGQSPSLFPLELWDVDYSPAELFVQGSEKALQNLTVLPERGLAVVGTRYPQARSLSLVRRIIGDLSDSGLVILSGLALGVDGAAHEAALDSGLPTIAVLAGGIDNIYPREHQALAQRILKKDGLIISEHPPGTEPRPGFFIHRNRLIAGWTSATWVVEAGSRSGALNTAKRAREHERECFATPCFPGDPAFVGNQNLLDWKNARPIWNISQLGQVWIHLAAPAPKPRCAKSWSRFQPLLSPPAEDIRSLTAEVRKLTLQQGSTSTEQLLEIMIERGWRANRFYLALQRALASEAIQDSLGLLVSHESLEKTE